MTDINDKKPQLRNIRRIDTSTDEASRSVIISSGCGKDLMEAIDSLSNLKTSDLDTELTQDEKVSIWVNYESIESTPPGKVFYDKLNNNDFDNDIEYENKRLGIKTQEVTASGRLTGLNAVAKFTAHLGIGKHTLLTLWHSGFTLLLGPVRDQEIINLHYAISKQEYRLGRETNNFTYSNYGVVINKLVTTFILDHVVTSSFTLPPDKEYIDFIKLTDLNISSCGMSACLHPTGYPITISCRNTRKMVDNKPECDFTASADVMPEDLIWVDRAALTTENLAHISKTSVGSHTAEDVIKYQESLEVNGEHTVELVSDSGVVTTCVFQTPTLRKHFDTGELWVNKTILAGQELFDYSSGPEEETPIVTDTIDKRNEKVDAMVLASVLNKYNHYVKSIKVGEAFVDDPATISDVLEVLSSDNVLTKNFVSSVEEYISSNYMALAATYNFDCPNCVKAGVDSEQYDNPNVRFKELIPLNAVEHFFDLSTLKFSKILSRQK